MNAKLARLAKWKLHRFYSRNPRIAEHLPPTDVFTPRSLSRFIQDYNYVYIKASRVHTGKGIVKAWRAAGGYRYVKVRGKAGSVATTRALYRKIMNGAIKSYIIQKDIGLARINGRPFDIRVMMMRDAERQWQFAGMIAKVAGRGSVVSNVRRGGGYATTVENALRKSLGCDEERIESIKQELTELGHEIMTDSEKYPFYSFQCGIDMAVDREGKVWIIEVNLHNPSHSLFNKISDKTYFRQVKSLYRSYRSKNKRLI